MSSTHRARIAELYERCGHSAARRAGRILGDLDQANDVLHEIFLELLNMREDFDNGNTLAAYLYSAITNRCLNRLRNHKTRLRLVGASMSSPTPSVAPDAYVAARQVLAKLPEEEAIVAVHYYFDELTHEEIATRLGCSRRHIGNILTRITQRHETHHDQSRRPLANAHATDNRVHLERSTR